MSARFYGGLHAATCRGGGHDGRQRRCAARAAVGALALLDRGLPAGAPPRRSELHQALRELAARTWRHPTTGDPVRFAFSTIERWYYTARRDRKDPVAALRKRERRDRGRQRALSTALAEALRAQHREHPSWSYKLHHDNLAAGVEATPTLGSMPSYASIVRFFRANALLRQRRITSRLTLGEERAAVRLEQREVRSFECDHVNGLWHADFHHGSLPVLTPSGAWARPIALGVLDDRSRLACHVQWYLEETARVFVHGLCQAFQKRALPGALLTDNGAAMLAAETIAGLRRLGIVQRTTLPYSPYQNGKQGRSGARSRGGSWPCSRGRASSRSSCSIEPPRPGASSSRTAPPIPRPARPRLTVTPPDRTAAARVLRATSSVLPSAPRSSGPSDEATAP